MTFPWNLIVCLLLVYLLVVFYLYAGKWAAWLTSKKTSAVVLTAVLVLLCVQGFTSSARFPHSLLFTGVLLLFAGILLLKVFDHVRHFRVRLLPEILSHTALALILLAAVFGRGDKMTLSVGIPEGETVGMATDAEGTPHALPFQLTLRDFSMDLYPSGEPRQYRSRVDIRPEDGRARSVEIAVNHPAKIGSWRIYQADYELDNPQWGTVSVLECVRDPWYPAVCTGLWLLLLAGLGMVVFAGTHKKEEKS